MGDVLYNDYINAKIKYEQAGAIYDKKCNILFILFLAIVSFNFVSSLVLYFCNIVNVIYILCGPLMINLFSLIIIYMITEGLGKSVNVLQEEMLCKRFKYLRGVKK